MFLKTRDGSFLDEHGKVLYFSCERFVRDICEGDCCFVCGASPADKPFNDEHVLPNWLLRRYGLHRRAITLSNDTTFRYDQYTIPCCSECNALMGREVEAPIRALIEQGSQTIVEHVQREGPLRFFVWLALIFLKTHLKDGKLRWHRDLRQPDDRIGELHTWEELHHLHTLARCFYTKCAVASEAFGSLLVMSVTQPPGVEPFDFADLSEAQTLLLRVDDVAFLAAFNDCAGAIQGLMPKLGRISGAVHELQLRELLAELAFVNLHIEHRPTFHTLIDGRSGEHSIEATRPPQFSLKPMDKALRGRLLHRAIRHAIGRLHVPGFTDEQVLAGITSGEWTFLFDDDGRFISRPDEVS
jgi:hypothetical protein